MNTINIDWPNSGISYADTLPEITREFNTRLEEYVRINHNLGLDIYAVLDKCINTLIDFKEEGIILECRNISISEEQGEYTFQFDYNQPDSVRPVRVAVNLEVEN